MTEEFSFVLTASDGSKRFGFCRRILLRAKDPNWKPICFCLISKWYPRPPIVRFSRCLGLRAFLCFPSSTSLCPLSNHRFMILFDIFFSFSTNSFIILTFLMISFILLSFTVKVDLCALSRHHRRGRARAPPRCHRSRRLAR